MLKSKIYLFSPVYITGCHMTRHSVHYVCICCADIDQSSRNPNSCIGKSVDIIGSLDRSMILLQIQDTTGSMV